MFLAVCLTRWREWVPNLACFAGALPELGCPFGLPRALRWDIRTLRLLRDCTIILQVIV